MHKHLHCISVQVVLLESLLYVTDVMFSWGYDNLIICILQHLDEEHFRHLFCGWRHRGIYSVSLPRHPYLTSGDMLPFLSLHSNVIVMLVIGL